MLAKLSLIWGLSILPGMEMAGQVEVGLNRPGLKWNQIETASYQLIFPVTRSQDARRVAGLLDIINNRKDLALGSRPQKIPVILQNQSVIPNGFVTLAPWRSEFLLTPPQFQFAGIAPWVDLLTIHEYRHVQQVSQARLGFPGRLLRVLFGQSGWAFNAGAIQPRWFLEGDAVYAETVFTQGGRGRTPAFENQYRALRLAGQKFNYEKASFWSYRDFVPSHYHLGYFLTTYARRNYGIGVWDRVLRETYSKPGLYRFSKALKKETGITTKNLYGAAMQEMDSIWESQDAAIQPLESSLLTSRTKKVYTNYRFPNYDSNGDVFVLKSSLDRIATVYRINPTDGSEQRIVEGGIGTGEHIGYVDGKLVWSEYRFHPRWFNQSYSVIVIHDIATGVKRKLTPRGKFFAPALSWNGKWVAAVEVLPQGSTALVVIETDTGKEIHRFQAQDNEFLSFPKWSQEDQTLFVAVRTLQGNYIKSCDLATREVRQLMPVMKHTVDRLFPHGKYVFFSSAVTGIQNIFSLDTATGEIFQVTESRFGAFDPALTMDGKKLAFSEYTAKGYEVRELDLDNALWRQSEFTQKFGSDYFETLTDHETGDITADIQLADSFQIRAFRHLTKGLFNVHSWYPYATTEEFGLGILSKNIMGSLSALGLFTYNTNEGSWKTMAQASYGAFFPILDLDITTGERQIDNLVRTTDTLSIIGYRGGWKEHSFGASLRVPFNLTHGNFFTNITIASGYRHFVVDYFDAFTDNSRDEGFGAMEIDVDFRRIQTSALRNILPRWAQTFNVNYQKTLGSSRNMGGKLMITGVMIFPGLMPNHSLFFTGGYQTEDIIDSYRFEDLFINARGYGNGPFESMYRISSNYTLPLWYPDLAVGSLAYFKRIRANLFHDYSEGKLLGSRRLMRSLGVELLADFRLVRLVDVGMGVRLGYQTDRDRNFVELVISSLEF